MLRQSRSFRAAQAFGDKGITGLFVECCGKAAAFVQRRRLAIKGHQRVVWWGLYILFSTAVRDVALRAIGLTGASARRLSLFVECCGKAAAFVQRRRLAIKGHHRVVWWCLNILFRRAVRDVALRAIGLTGASARRL